MKSRIFPIFLILGILCSLFPISAECAPASAKVGEYITFGHYEQDNHTSNGKEAIEWLVLDVQDGQALLISRYGLDAQPYNAKNAKVTWETCSLRKWLNDDFLNAAFSWEEQQAIVTTTVDNTGSSEEYSSNNTQDKVFILSSAEVYEYFEVTYHWGEGFNEALLCTPTQYAIARGADDSGGSYSRYIDGAWTGWWLLRTTFAIDSAVSSVGSNGYVGFNWNGVPASDGMIRPALVIRLGA